MNQQTETVLKLIKYQLSESPLKDELEKTIHIVHILYFLKEQLDKDCMENPEYIGSEEFHKLLSTIDAKRLKLINQAINL